MEKKEEKKEYFTLKQIYIENDRILAYTNQLSKEIKMCIIILIEKRKIKSQENNNDNLFSETGPICFFHFILFKVIIN